jgi:putative radical SAM enzyme (TIGR03279 family)
MPPGLRPSLYEYDDDYRMSVSRGNYITLTNLQEEEFERILDMGISPLYISVHAWDPKIRAHMMGNPEAAKLPGQMNRLAQGGVEMHTQIVLVPGYNDGDVLHHTVHQLAGLYPNVLTIGVVPVGLTRFRGKPDLLRSLTPQECEGILDKGHAWQNSFRNRFGKNLVYFADEFYLACGRSIPHPCEYDGFEQIENGIGMLSAFWDELQSLLDAGFVTKKDIAGGSTPGSQPSRHLITGILGAPFLHKCLDLVWTHLSVADAFRSNIRIHQVCNNFFGSEITVSGLITAIDIAGQIGDLGGEEFVVPRVMLKAGEDVFLDGQSVTWLEGRLKGRARIVDPDARGFLEAIR